MGIYRFGEFTLNMQTYELCRNGKALPIEPQVFSVQVCLIENRDRVVSKDDLISIVWKGRIVSDATLSSRVGAARRALRDPGGGQSLIKTIPRRGFRFVATDVVISHDERPNIRLSEANASIHDHVSDAPVIEPPPHLPNRQRVQSAFQKMGQNLRMQKSATAYLW